MSKIAAGKGVQSNLSSLDISATLNLPSFVVTDCVSAVSDGEKQCPALTAAVETNRQQQQPSPVIVVENKVTAKSEEDNANKAMSKEETIETKVKIKIVISL